jgi:hypothetical protein
LPWSMWAMIEKFRMFSAGLATPRAYVAPPNYSGRRRARSR